MKWSWLLLVGAVALVFGLLALDTPPPGAGSFPVEVIGPDGLHLSANVSMADATVYRVLVAALEAEGVSYTVEGTGESIFVTAIAGHANRGAGGWCFDVWVDGWTRPALGAGAYGLADGQASRWVYESAGCGQLS